MGAGVGKYPPSTDIGEEMSCESCSVRFSVLKRKKVCDECRRIYCAACAQKVPTRSSIRRCGRCTTLVNGTYSREDLHDFKAKELKQFLVKREISVQNCTEKGDFIDLILQFSNNSEYRAEQAERERHLQTLQERMRSNLSPPIPEAQRPPAYSEIYSTNPRTNSTTTTPSASSTPNDVESPTVEETPSIPIAPPASRVPESTENQEEPVAATTEPGTTEQPSDPPAGQVNETPPVATKSKLTRLSHIKTFEGISELSTRQLKEVLAGNFVDYKGCVEKGELRQRVERLWKENQQNQSVAEDIHEKGHMGLGDTELCKVCMDNVVDCVLLECGHMLTCTQCGKQLAECPICRQYVVRVVHVFKS